MRGTRWQSVAAAATADGQVHEQRKLSRWPMALQPACPVLPQAVQCPALLPGDTHASWGIDSSSQRFPPCCTCRHSPQLASPASSWLENGPTNAPHTISRPGGASAAGDEELRHGRHRRGRRRSPCVAIPAQGGAGQGGCDPLLGGALPLLVCAGCSCGVLLWMGARSRPLHGLHCVPCMPCLLACAAVLLKLCAVCAAFYC